MWLCASLCWAEQVESTACVSADVRHLLCVLERTDVLARRETWVIYSKVQGRMCLSSPWRTGVKGSVRTNCNKSVFFLSSIVVAWDQLDPFRPDTRSFPNGNKTSRTTTEHPIISHLQVAEEGYICIVARLSVMFRPISQPLSPTMTVVFEFNYVMQHRLSWWFPMIGVSWCFSCADLSWQNGLDKHSITLKVILNLQKADQTLWNYRESQIMCW